MANKPALIWNGKRRSSEVFSLVFSCCCGWFSFWAFWIVVAPLASLARSLRSPVSLFFVVPSVRFRFCLLLPWSFWGASWSVDSKISGRAAGGNATHISMHLRAGGGRQNDTHLYASVGGRRAAAPYNRLGGVFDHLGSVLGRLVAVLAASYGRLGASRGCLGPSCGHFGGAL